MAKTNLELAQQTQEKFYFYMTALVFTLLGLSIQTASFGDSKTANLLELGSWVSFLMSGLAALYRLELVPNVYESADGLNKLKKQKSDVLHSKNKGQDEVFIIEENKSEKIDDYIKGLDKQIEILETHIKAAKKSIERRYIFHRWSFIAGLLFIIFSRSYAHIARIILCN